MPEKILFRPEGCPSSSCEEVLLTLDEYEAIRLADLEGLYQEQAAALMNVSRQTFGRIVESARRKVADVLVKGKALRIEGGPVSLHGGETIPCPCCNETSCLSNGTADATICPRCGKQAENSTR